MIAKVIALVLGHLFLILFVLSFITASLAVCKYRISGRLKIAETYQRHLLLLAVGIGGVYDFIMHAFFPDFCAAHIGYAPSMFQFEVAVAALGYGVAGIMSFKADSGFRAATTIYLSCFMLGAAVGHIIEIFKLHNFNPGNCGTVLWLDILLPISLLTLLVLQKVWSKKGD